MGECSFGLILLRLILIMANFHAGYSLSNLFLTEVHLG